MLSGGNLSSQNQFESVNDDWWWSSVIHINESVPTQIHKKWQYDIYIWIIMNLHYVFLYMRKFFQRVVFKKVYSYIPGSQSLVPRSHYMIEYAKWVDIWSVANLSLMIAYFPQFFDWHHLLSFSWFFKNPATNKSKMGGNMILSALKRDPEKVGKSYYPYATVGWMYKYV